jgi:hypothetical protein
LSHADRACEGGFGLRRGPPFFETWAGGHRPRLSDQGLVFTTPEGDPLHPLSVSSAFVSRVKRWQLLGLGAEAAERVARDILG